MSYSDIDFNSPIVPANFAKWENRKLSNRLPVRLFHSIEQMKKANKIADCANFLDVEKTQYKRKIVRTYLCKNRFCFNCNFLKSRKQFATYHQVFRGMQKGEENISFIFLTLTVKNPHHSDLEKFYKEVMSQALKLLFISIRKKRGRFKHILGGLRAFEVTVQKSNSNYLHPHYHILFVVHNDYFDDMITFEEWTNIWDEHLRKFGHIQEPKPIINVKKVYAKDTNGFSEDTKNIDISKSVAETTKYSLKITDLNSYVNNPQAFKSIVNTFHRLRSWGDFGIVKEYKKKLDLKSAEEATQEELLSNGLDVTVDGKHELMERWRFDHSNYIFDGILKQGIQNG